MQPTAINWTSFSLSLAAAFAFGIFYACLVRQASKRNWVGQTAWSVVVGVTFTLGTMIPFFGIEIVVFIFCFFAAAGLPMVVEYLTRVMSDLQKDKTQALEIQKEFIDDRQASSR